MKHLEFSKRIVIAIALTILTVSITYAQPKAIKGIIQSTDSIKDSIDYYEVFVQDSTNNVLYINNFCSKEFRIDATEVAKWHIQQVKISVSVLGYQQISKYINLDSYTGESIIFELKPNLLSDVVITSSSPKSIIKDGNLVVKVQNSYLAKVGSLKKLLQLAPGVIQSTDGIRVIAAGTPIIMINKRQARAEEFETIQSRDILSIEIDRHPSAEFPAGTKAVIWVTTRERLTDITELIINNELQKAALYSFEASLLGNISKGPIKAVLRASYNNWNTQISEHNTVELYNNEEQPYFSDSTSSISTSKMHSFDVSGAIEYYFSAPHLVGVSYVGSWGKQKQGSIGTQYNILNEVQSQHLPQSNDVQQSQSHGITLYYYNANLSKQWLYITTSYIKNIQNTEYSMWLQDENNNTPFVNYFRSYNYDGMNLYVRYNYSPTPQFSFSCGTSNNGLTNQQQVSLPSVSEQKNTVHSHLYSINGNIFIQGGYKGDKVQASASVRYDYSLTKYNKEANNRWQKYQNLFPSLLFRYFPNKNYLFTLQYSYYNQLPSFALLDPHVYYQNQFIYAQGNPLLKSTQIQYISASASLWQQANVSVSYRYEHNPITFIATQGEYPNSIKMISVNTKQFKQWELSMDETFSWKTFTLFLSSSFKLPKVEVYHTGSIQQKWYFSVEASSMLTWMPKEWLSGYIGFDYFSPSYSNYNTEEARNNLKLGINCSLLDNKLDIGLEANDLLQGMNFGRWRMKLPNLNVHQGGVSDMRNICFNVSYRLGQTKSKALNIKGGDEIKSRL